MDKTNQFEKILEQDTKQIGGLNLDYPIELPKAQRRSDGTLLPGTLLNQRRITQPNPKHLSIVSEIRRQLCKRPRGQQKTYLELLVRSALNKAIKGQDPRMISEIINRVDGLPTQKIQVDAELKIEALALQLKALVSPNEANYALNGNITQELEEADTMLDSLPERGSQGNVESSQEMAGQDNEANA